MKPTAETWLIILLIQGTTSKREIAQDYIHRFQPPGSEWPPGRLSPIAVNDKAGPESQKTYQMGKTRKRSTDISKYNKAEEASQTNHGTKNMHASTASSGPSSRDASTSRNAATTWNATATMGPQAVDSTASFLGTSLAASSEQRQPPNKLERSKSAPVLDRYGVVLTGQQNGPSSQDASTSRNAATTWNDAATMGPQAVDYLASLGSSLAASSEQRQPPNKRPRSHSAPVVLTGQQNKLPAAQPVTSSGGVSVKASCVECLIPRPGKTTLLLHPCCDDIHKEWRQMAKQNGCCDKLKYCGTRAGMGQKSKDIYYSMASSKPNPDLAAQIFEKSQRAEKSVVDHVGDLFKSSEISVEEHTSNEGIFKKSQQSSSSSSLLDELTSSEISVEEHKSNDSLLQKNETNVDSVKASETEITGKVKQNYTVPSGVKGNDGDFSGVNTLDFQDAVFSAQNDSQVAPEGTGKQGHLGQTAPSSSLLAQHQQVDFQVVAGVNSAAVQLETEPDKAEQQGRATGAERYQQDRERYQNLKKGADQAKAQKAKKQLGSELRAIMSGEIPADTIESLSKMAVDAINVAEGPDENGRTLALAGEKWLRIATAFAGHEFTLATTALGADLWLPGSPGLQNLVAAVKFFDTDIMRTKAGQVMRSILRPVLEDFLFATEKLNAKGDNGLLVLWQLKQFDLDHDGHLSTDERGKLMPHLRVVFPNHETQCPCDFYNQRAKMALVLQVAHDGLDAEGIEIEDGANIYIQSIAFHLSQLNHRVQELKKFNFVKVVKYFVEANKLKESDAKAMLPVLELGTKVKRGSDYNLVRSALLEKMQQADKDKDGYLNPAERVDLMSLLKETSKDVPRRKSLSRRNASRRIAETEAD